MKFITFYFYYLFSFIKVKIKKLFFISFKKDTIPNKPQFSYKDLTYFKKLIKNKKNIIEYGMGGSTIYLIKSNKNLVSVETDKNFLEIIKSKLHNIRLNKSILFYENIGETNLWGYPIDNRINKKNLNRWKKYVKSPWKYIKSKNFPNVILIDGRFRVACAVLALKKIKFKRQSLVFFDDFNKRDYYNDVLKVAKVIKKLDRASILKPKKISDKIFDNLIEKFSKDLK